jgi:hypothetical protein
MNTKELALLAARQELQELLDLFCLHRMGLAVVVAAAAEAQLVVLVLLQAAAEAEAAVPLQPVLLAAQVVAVKQLFQELFNESTCY